MQAHRRSKCVKLRSGQDWLRLAVARVSSDKHFSIARLYNEKLFDSASLKLKPFRPHLMRRGFIARALMPLKPVFA